jgi:hypothetical protein
MMKKILLLVLFSFFLADAYAQVSADSMAYQAQRKKINDMLGQRKQKFGQYDQSLSQHTGIFGLQTKKDIRHSNDILMDIVKTDDDIFVQLKVLLDYKTFEQKEVQSHVIDADTSKFGYMNTINRLRDQNEKLKHDVELAEQDQQKSKQISLGIIFALLFVVILLLRAKFVKKGK